MKVLFYLSSLLLLIVSSSLQAKEPALKTKILIIGDSITAGYGVAKDDAYPAILKKILLSKNKKVEIVTAGSSGSTSASAFSRLRWHLKSKPTHLILALGGNDGLRGISPKSTEQNLQKAIELAKKNNLVIFLAGMKMPYNYGADYQKSFEQTFKNLVKKNKIKEIPFLLAGVGGDKKLNQADGIHPNEKGHKIVANNVAKILMKEI
jgi:acyl-CoA thioesterase-1